MLEHYQLWALGKDDFEIIRVEFQFEVPIPGTDDGLLVGTFDGLIRDDDSNFWVFEHKTFMQEPPPEFLTLDRQTSAYQWAAQQLMDSGGAACKNVLCSNTQKLPSESRINPSNVPTNNPSSVPGIGTSNWNSTRMISKSSFPSAQSW